MKKIKVISDTNPKSLKIKSFLMKKLSKTKVNKPNTIVVIGGDGFMLQTLKKNKNSKKIFMESIQKLRFFDEQIFLKKYN